MSFNIDDPLAGILSDGSDDSFFDDDILGKKKPAKKKDISIVEKKTALFDLDNVSKKENLNDIVSIDKVQPDESVNKPRKKPDGSEIFKLDSQQLNSSTSFKYSINDDSKKNAFAVSQGLPLNEKSDVKKSPFASKVGTSNEKIEILDNLMGPKKEHAEPLEKGKGSQSFLDDILGKPSRKVGEVTKPTTAKNQSYNFDSLLEKHDRKETSTKKHINQPVILHESESAQQKKTKSSDDWLGVFQDKNEDIEYDNVEMPLWLGGNNSLKTRTLERDTKSQSQKEVEKETSSHKTPLANKLEVETKEIIEKEKDKELKPPESSDQTLNFFHDSVEVQKEKEDVTIQGATLYLQQQEAQLMVALQLKAQDEKLAALQMRQKESQRVQHEAALAQHSQLDAMLQKQANHRIQMQAIINAHQDRIAKRIKVKRWEDDINKVAEQRCRTAREERNALLTSDDAEQDGVNDGNSYENTPNEIKESPSAKERKQLLQLIQSLQENHDKEIDLMETSYRRQLAFLEISLNQTEERMKEESEKVIKFYTEKINWLEEHHQLYKKWTEDNTISINERHNDEKKMLRQQHLENVKVLQEHHSELMENIKNAVKQEQALIRDSASFSTNIQELLADVKENKLKCHHLVEKVSMLTDKTQNETERSLLTRETQINDMIQQLKKERECFEKEKSESKDMIHMFEMRLKQMTATIEEDSVSLRKTKMEFEFEKATFSKQTEFAKNVLKKQNEEIKILKEDILKEYQEKNGIINEEKAKVLKDTATVAKEKASIQSLKMELEKMKGELEAQLEEMNEERSKLNLEKQALHIEEQRILMKSKDIQMLTKTAMEKQLQAEKKYTDAENEQRKYEERIRRIQEHVVSLNAREKQIAKEKIALSRERISLHNDWKKMDGAQQCSLCRSMPRTHEYNSDLSYDVPASRDYGEHNMSPALNSIEQEMAHLMGKTFGLRHDAGLAGVRRQDVPRSDDVAGEHLENIPNENGRFKDYMDPKLMMLRLDVQKVIHNLEDKGTSINKK